MSEWITCTLGEVAEFIQTGPFGSQLHQSDYSDKGIPVVMPQDMVGGRIVTTNIARVEVHHVERLKKHKLQEGDIVYSRRGDVGRSAYVSENQSGWLCGTGCLLVRLNKTKVHPRFIAYYLRQETQVAWVENNAVGITMLNLNTGILAAAPLRIPRSIEAQERIADELTALDAKIEHNNELIRMLEEQAQQVYDYWFMQFDFPDKNGNPYRSSGGKLVWCDELKREIPEGWNVASLGSYLDDTSTGDWGKDEPTGNYTQRVYCIRGADILNVDALPIRFILKKNSHKFLLPDDTVIEVSGGSPTQATGRSTFISEGTLSRYDSPLICTNFCQVLRQKDTAYARYFYQLWNKLYDAGIMFNYEGKTSGIKNLLVGAFCTIKWHFPPREIAVQFNDLIYPVIARLEHIKQEQKSLIAQRDFLLPLLMSGQVKVAE